MFRWVGLFLFVAVIMACGAGPSHFRRSYDVSQTFENFLPKGDYQYFYSGHYPLNPDAVVGIRPGYTLNSPYWEATRVTPGTLRQMVEGMLNTTGAEYNTEPNGAYIFDDQGQVIGVWYSVWALPVLQFTGEKEFTISRPVINFPRSNKNPESRGIWDR